VIRIQIEIAIEIERHAREDGLPQDGTRIFSISS